MAVFDGNPKTTVLAIYSPTNAADVNEVENFCNDLSNTLQNIPKHNILLCLGNFNARLDSYPKAFADFACSIVGDLKNGRVVQIENAKIDKYLTGEFGRLEQFAPAAYRWWMNIKYNETAMKYKFLSEGTYSPYRKWCSGQPDAGEIPAADRCVIQTNAGCWEVYDCNVGAMNIGGFSVGPEIVCEVDIR
ncbi:uncharacterized protein, partial [Clytia hemisphaerica]|uniref:uncharacterized protein n=1 Tax=Clytia hemisphaerica TaxID=252671 RepID=UPI0034D7B6D1